MEILTHKQIIYLDSLALTAVIDFWKDYDPKSVLLAYAELKRRNYAIPERLLKRQSEFCTKNNYNNIDTFLNTYLEEIGYNTYEEYFYITFNEYFNTEATLQKKEAENTLKNSDQSSNSYDKYLALRIISIINKVFACIIGTITFIVVLWFLDSGLNQIGMIFSLISIGCGGLIVLVLMAISELIMLFIDIEHNTRNKGNK